MEFVRIVKKEGYFWTSAETLREAARSQCEFSAVDFVDEIDLYGILKNDKKDGFFLQVVIWTLFLWILNEGFHGNGHKKRNMHEYDVNTCGRATTVALMKPSIPDCRTWAWPSVKNRRWIKENRDIRATRSVNKQKCWLLLPTWRCHSKHSTRKLLIILFDLVGPAHC